MKQRFVSVRHDGLGRRLQGILNTMVLARRFGGEFEFAWPDNVTLQSSQHHAIDPAGAVFAPAFLERHLNPQLEQDFHGYAGRLQGKAYDTHLLTADHAEKLSAGTGSTPTPLILDEQDLPTLFPEQVESSDFAGAFEQIAFSDRVSHALAAAEQVVADGPVAGIHMRSGDIVFGDHRAGGKFTRLAIPEPLAGEIAHQERGLGKDVILFGQAPLSVQRLCERTGSSSATALAEQHGLDPLQTWFFETRLMSLCQPIYSGQSAFAWFAARIGGKSVTQGYPRFSGQQAYDLSGSALPTGGEQEDLLAAFAHWAIANEYHAELRFEQRRELIARAQALDPTIRLYEFAALMLLVESQEFDLAEAKMQAFFARNCSARGVGSLFQLLRLYGRGEFPVSFEPAAARLRDRGQEASPEMLLCALFMTHDPEQMRSIFALYERLDFEHRDQFAKAISRHFEHHAAEDPLPRRNPRAGLLSRLRRALKRS